MRKTILIIGMAVALLNVIYSFFGTGDTGKIFGFEMNIWIYRLIWLALSGVMLIQYLNESKKFK